MTPRRLFFRQGAALAAIGLLGGCIYAPSEERVVRRETYNRPRRRSWWRPRRRRQY